MRFDPRAFLSGILFFLTLGTAQAQFVQYTTPGGPAERPESRKDEIDEEMRTARFRLGPVRVVPVFGVHDVAYQRSVRGPVETPADITATVEAGVRAYLRTGPKMVWRLQAVPEYVWWRKETSRRHLNGRYEAGAFGFFNRLTVEALGGRVEEQGIAHPEVLRLVNTGQTYARLGTELELTGALSLFAAGSLTEQDHLPDEAADSLERALEALDREERVTRAGVRWRRRNGLSVGLGVERSQTDFTLEGLDRSNAGTAPVLEVTLDRRRLFAEVNVAARSLEARAGSAFVPYDGVTGSAAVRLSPNDGLAWTVYGGRNLVYSILPAYAYLNDDRLGTSLQARLGKDLITRVFVETGSDDFTAFSAAAPRRSDDVFSYGGQITWNLWGVAEASLNAARTEIDSNLPVFDRSFSTVGFTISLSREL
jgi:hypothetical protein